MTRDGKRISENELLGDLTPHQQEAVTHRDGPLLILAGAGSGKTRVITRRVAWLIQQGVRPWNILAITFTNKAAGEMQRRVAELLPGNRVWISTFHSLGARLLRQYADRLDLDRNFTIYDQTDRLKVVKSALDASEFDNVKFTPASIMGAISKAKNQLLTPPAYGNQAYDFFSQTVAHIYPIYEKRLRDSNALDFDDLLFWPALAVKNNAELRAELDERFRYILIDEYQDTNKAQYTIARHLSTDYQNLCCVGDPDQSIYAFRGSDIRNILDFEKDFPDARTITLERNYRSTKAILRAASHLISHNTQRKRKDLNTENAEGQPVTVLNYPHSREEAEGIAARIKDAVAQGNRRYRDVAIFLRINALSRTLETAFLKMALPYQIVRGLAFYDRKENRDVLAYLRLLLNPRDNVSFLRIVNEPSRGIGKTSLGRLQDYAEPREMSLLSAAAHVKKISAIRGKAVRALEEFAAMMSELQVYREGAPAEVITQVIDKTGYRQVLRDSSNDEDLERLANIEELITAAQQFADENEGATIADFLESVTLASDVDGFDETQDSISVMTLHASKGLEFPVVYMMAMEQGILPHERSLDDDDGKQLEEERRLAFVGMTRAKEELYLSYCGVREFRGQTTYTVPSMFLEELPGDGAVHSSSAAQLREKVMGSWRGGNAAADAGWIDAGFLLDKSKSSKSEDGQSFREGMLVRHDEYGLGQITSVSGAGALRKIKVRFGKAGERTFLAQKAKLTIVDNK